MTSGERISQLHDVARPGELRKGLRLVDDLQTDPPVFTGPYVEQHAQRKRRP